LISLHLSYNKHLSKYITTTLHGFHFTKCHPTILTYIPTSVTVSLKKIKTTKNFAISYVSNITHFHIIFWYKYKTSYAIFWLPTIINFHILLIKKIILHFFCSNTNKYSDNISQGVNILRVMIEIGWNWLKQVQIG